MNRTIYSIEQISKLVKPVFDKYSFIEKAYLFGSYAANNAKTKSDIDIVVSLNEPQNKYFFEISPKLEDIIEKNIDIYCEEELNKDFLNFIRKEFIQIYDRKEQAL